VTHPEWKGITGSYAETIPEDVNGLPPKRRSTRVSGE
jgi:hypothetical protein